LLGTTGEATVPSSRAQRGIPSLNGPLARNHGILRRSLRSAPQDDGLGRLPSPLTDRQE
jgi:hypothetical protein